jgi:hypothetical protein
MLRCLKSGLSCDATCYGLLFQSQKSEIESVRLYLSTHYITDNSKSLYVRSTYPQGFSIDCGNG